MPGQSAIDAAKALLDICSRKKLTLATAESCTGGLVAATISEIAGSSAVLDRGFVTYSNEAKQQMLGVTPATIDVYGAVSTECAEEMAKGALATHRSIWPFRLQALRGQPALCPASQSVWSISARPPATAALLRMIGNMVTLAGPKCARSPCLRH